MDGFHHPRRFVGADQPPHHHGGGGGGGPPLWYPPPPSSSSPSPAAAAYPPPSAAPLHAYHHHPPPPPPPPHHQPWPHHPQPPLPPAYPPAYLPYPDPHRYQAPHPPPPRLHHLPPPLPQHPPPAQAWRNPSWSQHQGWEYPGERNIAFNNEEDWASRARAWAAAKSSTDNHYTDSQFTPIGRMEAHSHVYQGHYQQAVGTASTDTQQQLHHQAFVQQFSGVDLQRRDNQFHGSTSVSSGLPSYGTDSKDIDYIVSPSQRSFGPNSSIYEQEVPYSYSSSTGSREVPGQNGNSHMPPHVPSVQEGFHLQSTLPIPKISVEKPHSTHGGQSVDFLNDAWDKPLEFESRSAYDIHAHQDSSYGPVDPPVPVEMLNNDAIATSIKSWATSAASGIAFSQSTAVVSGTQIDPSFVSQSSLPAHPAPPFGGLPGSTFPPGIVPVSASFGLGTGASIHNASAFPGDANGAFSLSERPKKAAVPNWLRDEIIKQQSTIAINVPTHATGDSFHSIESEDAAKSLRKADYADSKSIDSTRSIEDGEDDEDDVDAARSAAINQEIKRVLTEVLLKVTDELFDEIATKVLSEDDATPEVDGSTLLETRKFSPSPPAVPTPKASAKVLVPVEMRGNKVDNAGENSSPRASGGDLLGLANYASDDGGDSETEGSNVPSSGMLRSGSFQQGNGGGEDGFEEMGKGSASKCEETNGGPIRIKEEEDRKETNGAFYGAKNNDVNRLPKNVSPSSDGPNYHKAPQKDSGIPEAVVPVDSENVHELSSENRNSLPRKDNQGDKEGKILESEIGNVNNGELMVEQCEARELRSISITNRHLADSSPSKNFKVEKVIDKKSKKKSEYDVSVSHEIKDKMKEEQERNDAWKDKAEDRIVKQEREERELDHKSRHKLDSIKDGRKDNAKSRREKGYIDGERKRDQLRDKKEDRLARVPKDSVRNNRRSLSPSNRGRSSKGSSLGGHASGSSDEPYEISRKRKLQSNQRNLSPSPTRSRIRQVLRSPHSKHSHSRHSPYSSAERRRRSRSRTPHAPRRSTQKK